ncbi:hypothetical protein CEXT_768011 [Caerostris extrusa]|uniref:Uncharacterized protein n=1 Tax=Caerostris extrusa TaxID=172846 RepID=A0AAV4QVG3_CAEEX|nr:hypothetical protein CEXT_768011 [Caerostris extrusa]
MRAQRTGSEDRGSSALADENRLLSLLPTFGDNGMQVGLDFKLPFFSIPLCQDVLSALSAPSIGGGLGSLFGSGVGAGYGSPSAATSSLASNLLGSGSGASSTVATMAAMAVTAALLYPKVTNLFSLDGKGVFRDGKSYSAIIKDNRWQPGRLLPEREQRAEPVQHRRRIMHESGAVLPGKRQTTAHSEGVGTPPLPLPTLPAVKKLMNKGGLVQARDFGGSGGDCDYFNSQSKCPIAAQTFKNMLSSLG